MKILAVDDNSVSGRVLQALLSRMGHEVLLAAGGFEAWDIFQREQPRIVLTDWHMPGLNGLELCQRIRQAQKDAYVYVIMITADTIGREMYPCAIEAGVDDFLMKPYEAETISARLRVAQRILEFYTEIQKLRRLVPICSYCKSVRNDRQFWESIETYLQEHEGVELSHSICPQCFGKFVQPEIDALERGKQKQGGAGPGQSPFRAGKG